MDKSKVRIRSKEELKSREEGFLEIVDILQKNNIYFFIQAGTVLGARRENYRSGYYFQFSIRNFGAPLHRLRQGIIHGGYFIAKTLSDFGGR